MSLVKFYKHTYVHFQDYTRLLIRMLGLDKWTTSVNFTKKFVGKMLINHDSIDRSKENFKLNLSSMYFIPFSYVILRIMKILK